MPSASRVHHLLYRLQTIKNRILLSAPQSTVNMDVKQLQYMNRQQSKLQIYICCQLSQQVVFPTERSYTFYTAGFGASTRVNTTYYTPNISYTNGEREKYPREEKKKQKKKKRISLYCSMKLKPLPCRSKRSGNYCRRDCQVTKISYDTV